MCLVTNVKFSLIVHSLSLVASVSFEATPAPFAELEKSTDQCIVVVKCYEIA